MFGGGKPAWRKTRACHPIVGRKMIRLRIQSAGDPDPRLRLAREGIQRDQARRILDEKSVKTLYSHVARGVQRGITTRVTRCCGIDR